MTTPGYLYDHDADTHAQIGPPPFVPPRGRMYRAESVEISFQGQVIAKSVPDRWSPDRWSSTGTVSLDLWFEDRTYDEDGWPVSEGAYRVPVRVPVVDAWPTPCGRAVQYTVPGIGRGLCGIADFHPDP